MPMTTCEISFSVYLDHFPKLTSFTHAVTPHLSEKLDAVPIYVDSTVVLMVAWNENFLKSLLSHGIQGREAEARKFFRKFGNDEEKKRAPTCDMQHLIRMGFRRVSYKNRGAKTENLFRHLFEFSLWPDPQTQDRIVDLNVLRQIVIHEGGSVLGDDYWAQLSDQRLVETTQYGDLPAIRRIDYGYCLTSFLESVFLAFERQARHIHEQMLSRPKWVYQSILGPTT